MATTTAAIYTRVSSDAQDGEDRTSLDTQLEDCQGYAASKGYQVDRVYREVGSGADRERPLYLRMLQQAAGGEVDVVIAWRADRLYRSLGAAADLIDACEAGGVNVEGANQHVDMGTLGLLAAVASMERSAIRERTSAGKRASAKAGRVPTKVPYGYRKGDDGKAVVHDYEAAIVCRIFDLATEGDLGVQAIGRVLASEGIASPSGGPRWHKGQLGRILNSRTYVGEYTFGRRRHEMVGGSKKTRRVSDVDEADWITVPVPAIISRETFEKARLQAGRRKRSGSAGTGRGATYLLKGLLDCHCGARMSGTASGAGKGRQRSHYVCATHHHTRQTLGDWPGPGCREKAYVRAPELDAQVWRELSEWLANPFTLADLNDTVDQRDIGSEVAAAEKALAKVDDEDGRAVRLYVSGSITETQLGQQRRYISERRDAAAALVSHLQGQQESAARDHDAVESVAALIARVGGTLDSMDDSQRAGLMRQVVEGVTLDREGVASIRVAVPMPAEVADPLKVSRSTSCWRRRW